MIRAAQQCTGAARPRPADAQRGIVESVNATNNRLGRRHIARPLGRRSFPSPVCKSRGARNSRSGGHDNGSVSEHDRRGVAPEQQDEGQPDDSKGPVVCDAPLLRGDQGGKGDLRGSWIDDALTQNVIGAFIEVHRHLGPGLLEIDVGLLINFNALSVRQGLRRIQRGRSSGAFPSLNSRPLDLPTKEGSASHDRPPSEP